MGLVDYNTVCLSVKKLYIIPGIAGHHAARVLGPWVHFLFQPPEEGLYECTVATFCFVH